MLIVITVQMIQNHYLLCNVVDVGYSSNNSKRERGGREGERERERERESFVCSQNYTVALLYTNEIHLQFFNTQPHCAI